MGNYVAQYTHKVIWDETIPNLGVVRKSFGTFYTEAMRSVVANLRKKDGVINAWIEKIEEVK